MGKGSTAKRKKELAGPADRHEQARERGSQVENGVPIVFAPPLRPRPRLLVLFSAILVLWVAFLLVMYFRTVYPHRNDALPPTQPLSHSDF